MAGKSSKSGAGAKGEAEPAAAPGADQQHAAPREAEERGAEEPVALGGAEAGKATAAKARAPTEIDLTATEIRDTTAARETEPLHPGASGSAAPASAPGTETGPQPAAAVGATRAQPPHKARPAPKLVPALLGLIAGAIGGFGAYFFGPVVLGPLQAPEGPVVDQAVEARVAKLEAALGQVKAAPAAALPAGLVERIDALEKKAAAPAGLDPSVVDQLVRLEAGAAQGKAAEAGLKAEIAALGMAITSETEERKRSLEALAQRDLTPKILPLSQPAPDLDSLKVRIGAVESVARALPESVNKLDAKLGGLEPKVEAATKELQVLAGRIAVPPPRDGLSLANARLSAAALAEEALARGRPMKGVLDLLKGLGTEAGALAPLAGFSEEGAPDARKLIEELRAIALPSAPSAKREGAPDFLERVKQGAMTLVEIRRTGEISGTDDAATLARAEQALQRGEIGAVPGLMTRLSPVAAPAYAAWTARVEARAKAAQGVAGLRAGAVAELAKAAATAK